MLSAGEDITMNEAGPSRPRRPSSPTIQPASSAIITTPSEQTSNGKYTHQRTTSSQSHSSRAESPETALSSRIPDENAPSSTTPDSSPPPHRPSSPRLDLANYPTPTLLRLIANLLQQIASANDQIRPDLDEPESNGTSGNSIDGTGQNVEEGSSGDNGSITTGRSRSSSQVQNQHPHPSPTSTLFTDQNHQPPTSSSFNSSSTRPTSSTSVHTLSTDGALPLFSASKQSLSHPSSLLSFHARHVPSITIEAYLLRILKYCPTTNEVFLGLLVYFDRMSKLGTPAGIGGIAGGTGALGAAGRKGFAIDSYNVHRLVIAGVTVASKFFSDVFYTNSRYAKVGGLPPHELNQLELQFLLLNDFRLAIPVEEMQKYGDRLLGYWEGRESETGVEVNTGRELSEGGRRRAKEKKEKDIRNEEERKNGGDKRPQPNEDDERRVYDNGMVVDDQAEEVRKDKEKEKEKDKAKEKIIEKKQEKEEEEKEAKEESNVKKEDEKIETDNDNPPQPPPEPAEIASAPVTPEEDQTMEVDNVPRSTTNPDFSSNAQPTSLAPSNSAPPDTSSSSTSVSMSTQHSNGQNQSIPTSSRRLSNSATPSLQSPQTGPPLQNQNGKPPIKRSSNTSRTVSFSRPDMVSGGMGIGAGVAVSGTG